jgi:SAM-dependent methyltransferase
MIAARTAFFARGHYHPLSMAIADAARVEGDVPVVADVGCGDGSHLSTVIDALGRDAVVAGVDLSKDAVRAAAKRERRATFIVGDANRLPFNDGVVDVVVVAFAPRAAAELTRIARPGQGVVVVAVPEPGHLKELVEVYGGIGMRDDKPAAVAGALAGAFTLVDEHVIDAPLALDAEDVALALRMTPHGRHIDLAAAPVAPLTTRLCARVLRFVARPSPS